MQSIAKHTPPAPLVAHGCGVPQNQTSTCALSASSKARVNGQCDRRCNQPTKSPPTDRTCRFLPKTTKHNKQSQFQSRRTSGARLPAGRVALRADASNRPNSVRFAWVHPTTCFKTFQNVSRHARKLPKEPIPPPGAKRRPCRAASLGNPGPSHPHAVLPNKPNLSTCGFPPAAHADA